MNMMNMIVGYVGVARHVISTRTLLQVLQRHIISPGRSFRFCKAISPELYLLDDLKTYMED